MDTTSDSSSLSNLTVGEKGTKYRLQTRIGSGTFGVIYLAKDKTTGEDVAVKLESCSVTRGHLLEEARLLHALRGGIGIPAVRWSGRRDNYNAMVIDLLGSSLETLLNSCGGTFSIKTVLMLADQMIGRLEYVHSKGIVHRDLNPENFLMGRNDNSGTVYLIDYGLAKRYRDVVTHRHIPFKDDKSFTGTARYASINSHKGFELSRRDDLESLGYIVVYFLKGRLPWQNVRAATQVQKFDKINGMKSSISPEFLCEGLPVEFAELIKHAKQLNFHEEPDYDRFRNLFQTLMRKQKMEDDRKYDWDLGESKASQVLWRHGKTHSEKPRSVADGRIPMPSRSLP